MADWVIFGQSFGLVIETIIRGILQGGLYSLIALGIVVINKASGIFNFAHGWMMFIGALFFWQFYANNPSPQITFGVIGLAVFVAVFVLLSVGITITGTVTNGDRARQNRLQHFLSQWQNNQIDKQQFLTVLGVGAVSIIVVAVLVLQDSSAMVRAATAALVGSIFLGLMLERFTIRPLLGQPVLTAILMTLAIGFMLQGLTQIIWGTVPQKIDVFTAATAQSSTNDDGTTAAPASTTIAIPVFTFDAGVQNTATDQQVGGGTAAFYRIETASWLGRDIRLPRFLVWGFSIAVATFVAFTLFFQYTSLGLAMRATAENQVLAESVGLQVRWTLAISWAMVAVMATMAGVVQGTGGTGVDIAVVPLLALVVFPAVLLGGLESITGAMVGGLVIGVVEKLTTIYVDTTAGQQLAPFLVLIIVLVIRPDGLFGQRRIDRV